MPEEKATKYVEEPAPLLCPVCKKVFKEPIISVKCGHTFCKRCIESLVSAGSRCPIDGQACESGQLVLNLAILGQLADLKIYCCYGLKPITGGASSSHAHGDAEYEEDPDGCPEKIVLGQRKEHEDSCVFAWAECPIAGSACGPIRKKDMEQHMDVCAFIPCPYSEFGCKFTGGKTEVSSHKLVCSFKDESQLLAALMKELKLVKSSHEELQKSLVQSNKMVEKLSHDRVTMVTQLEQQALTITALSSRMDKLETELESVKSTRMQRVGSNMRGEATPRYSRRERHAHNDGNHKRWSTESTTSLASCHDGMGGSRSGPFQWQMPFTVKCIGTFRGHEGTIWSLVTHSGHLYSGSSDGSIKVWDIVDLRRGCLKTVLAHNCTLCMTTGNGILYSSGTDLLVRSWHLDTLEEIGSIENAHESMASAMTCSKDYLFTSSIGCIKVWDAITLKEIHRMEGFSQSWVRALSYNKRKNLLYSSSSNKIFIWKCKEDFSLVESFETQHGALYSLATTRQYIITGTHSQNIQVYDIATLRHLHTLSGHIGRVTVLCVVDSGDFMFSGSSDSTVTVWNLDNMLPILTLQRHEKAVHSLAVWNDSVFTGSEDMEIKVFRHFKL